MWERQIVEFESRFRVIRYDLRGHDGQPMAAALVGGSA
jgi:hypothetical protein